MTIGNPVELRPGDPDPAIADLEHECLLAGQAGLVVHQADALNCETPPAMLGADVTPTATFYRRNHFPIPVLREASWRLHVAGMVDHPLSLSLDELMQLPAETTAITLECAGNARALFRPATSGVQWGVGAVGTAEWTGPRLSDVLSRTRIRPGACEVVFGGADAGAIDGSAQPIRFERSLPVHDALESGALLAYAMNGQPLPARHGYPLRLVVPGWYAVASVKWLTDIRVVGAAFKGFFQDRHYVYEGGGAREPVRLQRLRALITRPGAGQELAGHTVIVGGVAWSGAAPVARVEVSVAGGPWQKARLAGTAPVHAWQRWEHPVSALPSGEVSIRARAVDLAGQVQPDQPEWNRLGYGGTFLHEVRVVVR